MPLPKYNLYNNIYLFLFLLPKYKVSGIYKPQICRKLAARLRLIFAARLPQTRFSYANYFSGALFWHTMCAASMQHTVVAHCSGTQCAPQVCSAQLPHTVLAHNVCRKYGSAQLSRTILAHNVRRKFAAHCCRTLFLCASSLRRTVAVHCAVLPPYPLTPPHPIATPPLVYYPHCHIFLVPYPQGECEKKMWGW